MTVRSPGRHRSGLGGQQCLYLGPEASQLSSGAIRDRSCPATRGAAQEPRSFGGAADDRPDPVDLINRVPSRAGSSWLIPVRVARMVSSPYGFLRGTAIVMAADVARLPATGINPVVCGDSHLGNFGFYASPEGEVVIDLNDFDEAHPGSWEWDLRRLVASIWVAGRENGASEDQCRASVLACVAAYRTEAPVPGRTTVADA